MIRSLLNRILSEKEKVTVLFDQSLVSGVNFVVSALLARLLGLDQFGLFALAWMVVLFASSLHQALIISPLYTIYPKSEEKEKYLAKLTYTQILFSSIVLAITYIIVEVTVHLNPEWGSDYISIIISSAAAIFVTNDYFRRLMFSIHKAKSALYMDLIGYGLQPISILVLYHFDFLTLSTALISTSSLLGVSTILAATVFYKGGINKDVGTVVKQNWKFSKYLFGTAILQWFTGNMFIVVAGTILGPFAVGAVRMAQNIVGVLHILFLAMENIIPLRAAEVMKRYGEKRMLRHIGKSTLYAAVPTLVILASIVISAPILITKIYGAQYLEYKELLYAFTGLYILIFIGTMVRFIIRTKENNRVILVSYVICTLISVATAKPTIELFGIYGVILGLFMTQLITIGIYLFTLKTELKWLFK